MISTSPGLRLPQELLASTAFLLGRVGGACKGRAVEEFDDLGFSPYHYGVLALLNEGERETQATIADALSLDRSQLVGVLDGLEEKGLVERRRDPKDRRRHTVSLTPEGKRQLVKMRTIVDKIEETFFAPLDAKARAALRESLACVAANYDRRLSGAGGGGSSAP